MSATVAEKLREMERDLAHRELNYPRWVESGSLSADLAERRLRVMRGVVEDYRAQAAWERGEEVPGQPDTQAELELAEEMAKEMVGLWAAAHSVAATKLKRLRERKG
jgi:hypothetical protein